MIMSLTFKPACQAGDSVFTNRTIMPSLSIIDLREQPRYGLSILSGNEAGACALPYVPLASHSAYLVEKLGVRY